MRKVILASAIVSALTGGTALAADTFTLSSPDIKAGGKIADKHYWNSFGCSGANEMPALEWKGAPAGSFPPATPPLNRSTLAGMLCATQCQKPLPVGASLS